jgi:hypothetical protein
VPGAQLVQVAALPLQLRQFESQALQIRSASAEHAALWYSPVGQAPEQATQAPPLKNVPPGQAVQLEEPVELAKLP